LAFILNIETATEVCSVALAESGKMLVLEEETKVNSHSSTLTVLIQRLFDKTLRSMTELDAVAVSEGPGSYTGLRIGISAAKGLCYSLNKPLIAVSTLKAMASGMIEFQNNETALYCPVLDSIRNEVYVGVYDAFLNEVSPPSPADAGLPSLNHLSGNRKVFLAGTGLKKLHLPSEFQVLHLVNTSKNMVALAENLYTKNNFVSLEYFEPLYLKNFFAGER